MQSAAVDVYHSVETAGSHVYIQPLPSLLQHEWYQCRRQKRGCSRPSCPRGHQSRPTRGRSPSAVLASHHGSGAPPVRRGSETAEGCELVEPAAALLGAAAGAGAGTGAAAGPGAGAGTGAEAGAGPGAEPRAGAAWALRASSGSRSRLSSGTSGRNGAGSGTCTGTGKGFLLSWDYIASHL